MIGFLIFIFIVLPILIFIFLGIIGLLTTISSDSATNKAREETKQKTISEFSRIFEKMGLQNVDIIDLNISDEALNNGIDEYYTTVKELVKTDINTNALIPSYTNAGRFANDFYNLTNLKSSLDTISIDIDYIAIGSGLVEYKKMFESILGKNCLSKNAETTVLKISQDTSIKFTKERAYQDYTDISQDYSDEYYFHIEVLNIGNVVLSTYTDRNLRVNNFKPGLWIKEIGKIALQYDELRKDYEDRKRKNELSNQFLR
jgi:hypothetical protein